MILDHRRDLSRFNMSAIKSSIEKHYEKLSSNSVDELANQLISHSPSSIQPYLKLARVDKPVGFWLIMWPSFAGLALGSGTVPSLLLVAKFGIGAVLMRSIGCVINDIWDKDFDWRVERTRSRPITNGDLTVNQAMVFGGIQSVTALAILASLNLPTIGLGLLSLPLVATYPYLKRVTYYPQIFLGLCMNYGLLMGVTATSGTLSMSALGMYTSLISWTVFYDTIYALQDKKDDLLLGLKSTAIKFGDDVNKYLYLFTGVTTTGLFMSGQLGGLGPCYYLGVGFITHLMLNQIKTLKADDSADCLNKFKQNTIVGIVLFFGVLLGSL